MPGVRGLEHRLARAGVVGVGAARLEVDRRQLPALEGVFQALGEALFLPFLVGAQPVLEPHDAVRSEERRAGKEWGITCRSRWSPYPSNKNTYQTASSKNIDNNK